MACDLSTSGVKKITLAELQRMIIDPEVPDEALQRYVKLDAARSGPFSPSFDLDTALVEIPPTGKRSALGLNLLNAFMRTKRRLAFDSKIASGYDGPIIVSEGDSWFQHPLITDTIDHLSEDHYAVRSLDAAGDLLEAIVDDGEYVEALEETRAPYFLLSAGGNDALGGGNLREHLRPFDPRITPSGHLLPSYDQLIDHALSLFDQMFRTIEPQDVVTFCHGYDYAIPQDQTWLGQPMRDRDIIDPGFQREIVRAMVDNFNARLGRLAARFPKVRFIDLRGTVRDDQWYDELHPTGEGYAAVAQKFFERIEQERAPVPRSRGAKRVEKRADRLMVGAVPSTARRGLSLHVGVNLVDPKHYVGIGEFGELASCELDAEDMENLAREAGYADRSVLLGKDATREAVMAAIGNAAAELRPGDIFLWTYAGHGHGIRDENGDEEDGQDEAFCLYDGMMLDDELYDLWRTFRDDVRILVVSDSCHSGTNVRSVDPASALRAALAAAPVDAAGPTLRSRRLPPAVGARTLNRNRAFYEKLMKRPLTPAGRLPVRELALPLRCSVQLLSGCQDNQTSYDGPMNGRFTEELLKAWDGGSFRGGYELFHRRIVRGMPPDQTPNFWATGKLSPSFRGQKPFSI